MAICFFRSQLKNSRRLILSLNPRALIEPIVRSFSFVAVKKKETGNFHPKKKGGTQREYSSKPLTHSIVKRILVFKR